jgi:hypothetical protein
MKQSGPPNAFEQRFTKLICDRAEVADSEKVQMLTNKLKETKEQLKQAQKEIRTYQYEIHQLRDDHIDIPSNPLGNFCTFCNHVLPDWGASQCKGTKCDWMTRDLPCRAWCLKRKGAVSLNGGNLKYYTCSTDKCDARVCGTYCTMCHVCETKMK